MWTYANTHYCFQLNFPDDWSRSSGFSRIPYLLANTINRANVLEEFTNKRKEYLNIVMERMRPEIPPDVAEMLFRINALKSNYTEVEVGRVHIEGRDHCWGSYVMSNKGWLKKYMLVLNGWGYALTASCPLEQRSSQLAEGWDRIAGSFKLTGPPDPDILALNNSAEAGRLIAVLRAELWRELERTKRNQGM